MCGPDKSRSILRVVLTLVLVCMTFERNAKILVPPRLWRTNDKETFGTMRWGLLSDGSYPILGSIQKYLNRKSVMVYNWSTQGWSNRMRLVLKFQATNLAIQTSTGSISIIKQGWFSVSYLPVTGLNLTTLRFPRSWIVRFRFSSTLVMQIIFASMLLVWICSNPLVGWETKLGQKC